MLYKKINLRGLAFNKNPIKYHHKRYIYILQKYPTLHINSFKSV